MKELVELEIGQILALLSIAENNGISSPFTRDSFQSVLSRLMGERDIDAMTPLEVADLRRMLITYHKAVHEVLYTPPRR